MEVTQFVDDDDVDGTPIQKRLIAHDHVYDD